MLSLMLLVAVQVPTATRDAGGPATGPAVQVQLGSERLTLPAPRGRLPPSAVVPDHTHEGARTHCWSVAGPPAGHLLLEAADLGVTFGALHASTGARPPVGVACPRAPGPTALWYGGHSWSLASPPAAFPEALGPPTKAVGDTLRWIAAWEWDVIDSTRPGPGRVVRVYADAGLELVVRGGRVVYLGVWRQEET